MLEYVGEFKIAVHDLVLNEGLKSVKDLDKVLDGLFFRDVFLLLEVGPQVSLIAVLQNQVDVINSLLDIDQSNDVVVSA